MFRYFPKSKKAAAILLYNLWSDKDLQGFLKKVSHRWEPRSPGLGVASSCFLPFTPLSGICENQMAQDWRINQRSQKKNKKKVASDSVKKSTDSGLKNAVFWPWNVRDLSDGTRARLSGKHLPEIAPSEVQLRSWVCRRVVPLTVQWNYLGGTLTLSLRLYPAARDEQILVCERHHRGSAQSCSNCGLRPRLDRDIVNASGRGVLLSHFTQIFFFMHASTRSIPF